ncbi:hypothetical protein AGLY_006675 [Aphis glycines]|uniref:FLYWCH-type domain-containing protein n=1 Tax=Aphis glycines TaxID=307491 RepID=A0A6G0TS99_APHGL|nr:hypothetical protein AGLY_006675 [Aphis glycines]
MAMFLKSKRDKDMVSFNNFKYNFASKNVSTDEIRWRCVKRTCSATIYTSNSKVVNEEDILITDQLRYNHKSCSDAEINRQIVKNTQLTDGFTSNGFNVIRKSIYRKLGLVFIPKFVTIDFEKAIHLAVNEVWPSSKIVGCRFHLIQAWYRNVQKYGLATEYQNNTSIEPSEVSDCFTQDLMAECPTDEELVKYCDYLVENYISEDSVFSPTLWACNSASIQLTTNACESFHSYFNMNFYSNSPSIISWLNIKRNDIQTETYIKINSVEILKKTKDKKTKERQEFNEKRILLYRSGEITRFEFVKSMCRNFKK